MLLPVQYRIKATISNVSLPMLDSCMHKQILNIFPLKRINFLLFSNKIHLSLTKYKLWSSYDALQPNSHRRHRFCRYKMIMRAKNERNIHPMRYFSKDTAPKRLDKRFTSGNIHPAPRHHRPHEVMKPPST